MLEGFRDGEAGQGHVASEHFAAATRELPKRLARTPEVIHAQTDQEGWDRWPSCRRTSPDRSARYRNGR